MQLVCCPFQLQTFCSKASPSCPSLALTTRLVPGVQDTSDEAEQRTLLERWGKLHLARTVLSIASTSLMLYTLFAVRSPPKHRA